jgi:hypothetical protein
VLTIFCEGHQRRFQNTFQEMGKTHGVYVRYADELVLLANTEMAVYSVIDRVIEIGRCYGMEMNAAQTLRQ